MMTHRLKTWPEPFAAMWEGSKAFEFRPDDRNVQTGDRVELEEWDPATGAYSGRMITGVVGFVLRGAFGVPEGFCVFSVLTRLRWSEVHTRRAS